MKKFLLNTILFALPILFAGFTAEILLRNIPNDYAYKKNLLKKKAGSIETLFLGSSHAYYGINPDFFSGNSFNLSHISQSIDLDYMLLKKFTPEFRKLKYIVVPIDYFSLYSRTSTGIENWRIKNYNIYYDLNISLDPKNYSELLSVGLRKNVGRIFKYYYFRKEEITSSINGYGENIIPQADLYTSGIESAKRHTAKNFNYFNESVDIVNDFISFGYENNIYIIFYTNPVYSSYIQNMDESQYNVTVNTIEAICNEYENVYYFNFVNDKSFFESDFRDADHLNKLGAKKLTKSLDFKIDSLKNID